jgi:hypothetical protein
VKLLDWPYTALAASQCAIDGAPGLLAARGPTRRTPVAMEREGSAAGAPDTPHFAPAARSSPSMLCQSIRLTDALSIDMIDRACPLRLQQGPRCSLRMYPRFLQSPIPGCIIHAHTQFLSLSLSRAPTREHCGLREREGERARAAKERETPYQHHNL